LTREDGLAEELEHFNGIICISRTIQDFIEVPENFAGRVQLISPPFDDLLNCENKHEQPSFTYRGLVFFISIEEFSDLTSIITTFPEPTYTQFVLIDSSNGTMSFSNVDTILSVRTTAISESEFRFLTTKGFQLIKIQNDVSESNKRYINQLHDTQHDHEALIDIGKALSVEKDPDRLLRLILYLSKKITGADAGSIYLIEEREDGTKQLRFKYSHTFSKELPYEEFTIPMDANSIAGYVAVTRNVLNIPDVYLLNASDPVSFNSSFDRIHDYRSKSMLVVPMVNHLDQAIGVIQLINSKEYLDGTEDSTGNEAFEVVLSTPEDFDTKVVPFDERYESLMESVASQAAIAIENNRMMLQIRNQFEEFVKASVIAIESRDIATSGHSFRVAQICMELAEAINKSDEGPFKDTCFSESELKELEYAALLHDFGKVYIDVAIFQKAKKLYPRDLDNLLLKMDYLYRYQELMFAIDQVQMAIDTETTSQYSKKARELEEHRNRVLQQIMNIKDTIVQLNEPVVLDADVSAMLDELESSVTCLDCVDIEGNRLCILTPEIETNLGIQRGSLNPKERKEIESHVTHTYNFVSKIPWPPEYRRIPEFALKHHEKMDGTGYPDGVKGEENIPLQARMIALADIYDALIATDRPYKSPITLDKALAILKEEGNHNKLDNRLVELFITHRIFEKIDRNDFRIIR